MQTLFVFHELQGIIEEGYDIYTPDEEATLITAHKNNIKRTR